jgi:hypothetical protein
MKRALDDHEQALRGEYDSRDQLDTARGILTALAIGAVLWACIGLLIYAGGLLP